MKDQKAASSCVFAGRIYDGRYFYHEIRSPHDKYTRI